MLFVLAAPAATAQEAPQAAVLSPPDRADVRRIESYLGRIDTLRARFLQVASDGSYAEGDLYLWRPGRLRMEYDSPVPILIVADGRALIYYDRELEQVSYLGLDSTPAGILLADTVSFSGGLTITGFERGEQSLRVTLAQTADPFAGSITLVVGDNPMALRKWTVLDAQGVTTTVSLFDARFGLPLNADLFRFTPQPERDSAP